MSQGPKYFITVATVPVLTVAVNNRKINLMRSIQSTHSEVQKGKPDLVLSHNTTDLGEGRSRYFVMYCGE